MRIVKIEWTDSIESTGWRTVDEFTEKRKFPVAGQIVTVGILVEETDEYVIIATSIDGQEKPNYCATMIIPTHAITDYMELEIEGEKR